MNKITEKLAKQAAKMIDTATRDGWNDWPPVCLGPMFEPERPEMPSSTEE